MGSDIGIFQEVEKLSALRRRLLNSLDAENKNDANQNPFSSRMKADMLTALKFCRFYKSLISTNVKSAREKIDAIISTLINYIHNKHRSYDFYFLKID